MINQKHEQGFTVMELVITIGVSIVLLLGFFNLYDWHQKVFLKEAASVRVTGAARSTLLSMSESIAQAVNIETSHDFSGTTYSTGGTSLVLELPSVNGDDDVIFSTYDYVAFYLSNGSIYQITESNGSSVRLAGTRLLGENIQSFALTYNNGDPALASSVSVDLQAVIVNRTNTATTRVNDLIFLRNK